MAEQKECKCCEEKATIVCFDCKDFYCDNCFNFMHKKAKNKIHKKAEINQVLPIEINCSKHKEYQIIYFCLKDKGKNNF